MLARHALSSERHVSRVWCFSLFLQQSLFRLFLYVYDVKEHKHVYFLFIYIPRYVYTNVGGCVMIKVQ